MKGESKKEVLNSIEELISMLRLLTIKVDSVEEDSDLLPYIAFSLDLGKTATSTLHKKFMIDQMKRSKKLNTNNLRLTVLNTDKPLDPNIK